ncbi:uncharacterized protein LOC131882478 [Tigriopus californicus]|uniref:uncharacterized protein LOC131882478 n=1 Tax=Tigriopus californicus TaxID=6832 RepID=UPI0027DA05EB|nr:uncharacterized protein LOC131882478 [Tigriopus californicus]
MAQRCFLVVSTVLLGQISCSKWMLDDSKIPPDDPRCLSRMSCKGRCGDYFGTTKPLESLCACDEDCNFFGDCCKDYTDYCPQGVTPVILHHHGEVQCFAMHPSMEEALGVYVVSQCPPSFSDATIRSMCEILDDFNKTLDEKIWFKNSFCQQCWLGELSSSLLAKLRKVNGSRYCIPELNGCRSPQFSNALQKEICDKYYMPVLYEDHSSGMAQFIAYNNLDCLTCDTEEATWDQIYCYPLGTYPLLGSGTKDFTFINPRNPSRQEVLFTSVLKNAFSFGIPESISILINFGFSEKHVMYSAEEWNENCGSNAVYDPFSEVCRALYCNSNFDLSDFECLNESESNGTSHGSILLPSADVLVRLGVLAFTQKANQTSPEEVRRMIHTNFEIQFCDFLYISHNRTSNLSVSFVGNKTLSGKDANVDLVANITQALIEEHRLTDYIIEYTELQELVLGLNFFNEALEFTLNFVLKERAKDNRTQEDATDRVIAHLTEIISENNFQFEMNGIQVMVTSMHESTLYSDTELAIWCRGGQLTNYTHDLINISIASDNEKSVYDGNWTMSIVILESGENFSEGEFVANLMYQGVYHDDIADFSGTVLVCENRAFINDSACPRVRFKPDQFDWDNYQANKGDLNFTGDAVDLFGIDNPLHHWQYKVLGNGDIETCVDIWMPPFLMTDLVEAYLSLILTSTSALCLLITLLTYSLFSELRNLPGLNLMGLALSTFTYQVVFLSGVNEATTKHHNLCILVAVIVHFCILNSFFWTNVMAWDIYQTFGKRNIISRIRPKRYIRKYTFYTCGSSFLIVSFAVLCDFSEVIPNFHVGYGQYSCWISNAEAAAVFIALPVTVILIANIVLYLLTISSINHVSNLVRNRGVQSRRGRRDVLLYIRIFCILGFTWLFGLLTILVPSTEAMRSVEMILVYFHVIFNGLQGVFIFSVFTTNKRVFNLYKEMFKSLRSKFHRQPIPLQNRSTHLRHPPAIEVHHHLCTCAKDKFKTDNESFHNCLSSLEVNDAILVFAMDEDGRMKLRNRKASNESNASNQSTITQSTSLGSFRQNSNDTVRQFECNLSDVDEDRETTSQTLSHEVTEEAKGSTLG